MKKYFFSSQEQNRVSNPEKARSDHLVCAGGQSEHTIDPTLPPYNPCLTYLHLNPG